MKKRLLPIALLTVLGLVGCTPAEPSTSTPTEQPDTSTEVVPAVKSVTITNKADLTKEWKAYDDVRAVNISVDPAINIVSAIRKGELTITSSDSKIITTVGKNLYPMEVGKATITVAYKGVSDKVEIEVIANTEEPPLRYATIENLASTTDVLGRLAYHVDYKVKTVNEDGTLTVTDVDNPGKEMKVAAVSALSHSLTYDVAKRDFDFVEFADTAAKNRLSGIKADTVVSTISILEKVGEEVVLKSIVRSVDELVIANRIQSTKDVAFTAQDKRFASEVFGEIKKIGENRDTHKPEDRGDVYLETPYSYAQLFARGFSGDPKQMVVSAGSGNVQFLEPNDFNGNEATKALKVKDKITALLVRNDYKGNAQTQGVLTTRSDVIDTAISDGVLPKGQSQKLFAKDIADGANKAFTYESSNPEILTVSESGEMTGVALGEAVVTVKTKELVKNVFVKVVEAKVAPEEKTVPFADVLAHDTRKPQVFKTDVKVSYIKANDAYGNLKVTDLEGNNETTVYGSSAKDGIKWDMLKGEYYFSNPKDYNKNEVTLGIKVGDTLTIRCIRADYSGNKQINAHILEIKKGESSTEIPEPAVVTNKTLAEIMAVDFTKSDVSYRLDVKIKTFRHFDYQSKTTVDSETPDKSGQMIITDLEGKNPTEVFQSNKHSSSLAWNVAEGQYEFSNTKDFTADLAKIGDTLTVRVIRADHTHSDGTVSVQLKAVIEKVNGVAFPADLEMPTALPKEADLLAKADTNSTTVTVTGDTATGTIGTIKLTSEKHNSNYMTNVQENHVRWHQGTTLKIENDAAFKTIVFETVKDNKLKQLSLENAAGTIIDGKLVIVLAEATTSFTFELPAQLRSASVALYK